MKTTRIKLALLAGVLPFVMISCGGADQQAESQESAEEMVEETTDAAAVTADINLETSDVNWEGTMVGVYSHSGTLKFTAGSIETKGNEITGGSFTVDMTSMQPTDENYDPSKEQTPEKLVGHLSSAEFFDVESHPSATFVITGSSAEGITGDLTIRGITNSETVTNVTSDGKGNFSGNLVFDRKKYDVAWDSPMKEMVLSNEISLTVNLKI